RCRFSLQIARGGGVLDIVYPLSMLEPVRLQLQQERGPVVDVDPRWQQALAQGVSDASVATHCLLAETKLSLGEIAALDVGDVIPLGVQGRSLLTASGIPMFRGRIGVNAGNLALKIIADV
ncbi:MAG: FliM/FliN family flagellar motor switch protein, partial [Spongiibacteraceae bacterium]